MVLHLFLSFLLFQTTAAAAIPAKPSTKWPTLSGDAPAVIARGGYSGLFPEASQYAYQFAISMSLSDVVLFCDLQLTKDGSGLCHSNLQLDNSTTIATFFPKGQKTYTVNGEPVTGWFAVDYTADQLLNNVSLIQNIFSRPSVFDGSLPLSMVEDVAGLKPPRFWLNVQYGMFYKEHKLDIADFALKASRFMGIDYISSPEIGFLKSINGKIKKTKLVFRFLEGDAVEPTTKQTYSSLLKDLPAIKSFASGIMVPKTYIWPVGSDQYLQPHTSLVADAHQAGLEVFASGFANDMPGSFNYSYDPTAEYLQFVGKSDFAVDGVLTDFPSTASETIACLAQNKNNAAPGKGKPLIITHNGASGVYSGCTDLAYQQAVDDGADIIDCSVQMSKDGVAFCLNSADLTSGTNAMAAFMPKATMIPEIQKNSGIFSFDLTWSDIQTLKPSVLSPLSEFGLLRNPAVKSQGKIMTLAEFLDFAKEKKVAGILLNIENAAYLASNRGLAIADVVSAALTNASSDKSAATQEVLIQSDDTAVLSKFKQIPGCKRVLDIGETISDAPRPAVDEVKHVADAVNLPRSSIISNSGGFLSSFTGVVDEMHAANVSVYVSVLRNEFVSIAFDFFSDPMVELATYASVGVDGVVTEFPATASSYMRSPCFNLDAKAAYTILPAQPGSLLQLAQPDALPPAEAPAPVLEAADVIDPPLPPVKEADADAPAAEPTASPQHSGQSANPASAAFCLVVVTITGLLSLISY